VVISPTALPYDSLRAEDVCLVTADSELVEGPKPSVELPMHLAVLAQRDDVGAVVHTHSPYATALSLVGDSVPVAEAAPSGTPGSARPCWPPRTTATPWSCVATVRSASAPISPRALARAFTLEENARIRALAKLLT
jgi:L-fuculose-phosphate aldolase